MDITGVVYAAGIVGIVGLLVGILLVIAAEKFKIEENPLVGAVRELLPGANCGGCGFAGCDACADAIAAGKAPTNACPVGGPEVAKKIAIAMGMDPGAGDFKQMVAFVKCAGTCDKAVKKYDYYGIKDCYAISVVPGSDDKGCEYGCMGYGACVKACKFDAMHIVDGVAVVDEDKCTGCQACIKTCPQHIIALVPKGQAYKVQCSSHKRGKDVMSVCQAGCIGCTLCTKQCEFDAIHMDNNVAVIDYDKCTGCGKCAEKCPKKIIIRADGVQLAAC